MSDRYFELFCTSRICTVPRWRASRKSAGFCRYLQVWWESRQKRPYFYMSLTVSQQIPPFLRVFSSSGRPWVPQMLLQKPCPRRTGRDGRRESPGPWRRFKRCSSRSWLCWSTLPQRGGSNTKNFDFEKLLTFRLASCCALSLAIPRQSRSSIYNRLGNFCRSIQRTFLWIFLFFSYSLVQRTWLVRHLRDQFRQSHAAFYLWNSRIPFSFC